MHTKTTTIPALLIPANLSLPMRTVEIPNSTDCLFTVSEMIGCTFVTRTDVSPEVHRAIGMPTDMWVDDCGLMVANPKFNLRAALLTGQNLYGDAILTGSTGEDIVALAFKGCAKDFLDLVQRQAEKISKISA